MKDGVGKKLLYEAVARALRRHSDMIYFPGLRHEAERLGGLPLDFFIGIEATSWYVHYFTAFLVCLSAM
jgi:hypothetical protein